MRQFGDRRRVWRCAETGQNQVRELLTQLKSYGFPAPDLSDQSPVFFFDLLLRPGNQSEALREPHLHHRLRISIILLLRQHVFHSCCSMDFYRRHFAEAMHPMVGWGYPHRQARYSSVHPSKGPKPTIGLSGISDAHDALSGSAFARVHSATEDLPPPGPLPTGKQAAEAQAPIDQGKLIVLSVSKVFGAFSFTIIR